MGRLEDIATRNRPGRPRERVVVMFAFGAFVLLILGLMLFTNLGERPTPTPAAAPPPNEHRVDDVKLRTPRADAGTDAPR